MWDRADQGWTGIASVFGETTIKQSRRCLGRTACLLWSGISWIVNKSCYHFSVVVLVQTYLNSSCWAGLLLQFFIRFCCPHFSPEWFMGLFIPILIWQELACSIKNHILTDFYIYHWSNLLKAWFLSEWIGLTFLSWKFQLVKYSAFTIDMLPQWKLTHKRMLNKL